MKNAMKKIMSLLLAAVLLVSAVPFQASAAGEVLPYAVFFGGDKNGDVVKGEYTVSGNSLTWQSVVAAAAAEHDLDTSENSLVKIYVKNSWDGEGDPGEILITEESGYIHIILNGAMEEKGEEAPTTPSEPERKPITMVVTETESGKNICTVSEYPANGTGAKLSNMLKHWWRSDWSKSYTTTADLDATIAAGETVYVKVTALPIKVKVKINDVEIGSDSKAPADGISSKASDLLTYVWNKNWESGLSIDKIWSTMEQEYVSEDTEIMAGDTVTFAMKSGSSSSSSSSGTSNSDGEEKVYLGVYVNNNTKDMHKVIDVTKYVEGEDEPYLDRYEAERAIKKYYTAKDGYTLKMYGLFTYDTWKEFLWDDDTDGAVSIPVDRSEETYIYVLVNNVYSSSSSSTADSSNPKTGDEVFMTITAMSLSASALICLYFLNKKRMAE